MASLAYEGMKTQISRGNYTEVEAKQAITQLYIKKMITEKEFNALMNLSDGLNPNTNIGEIQTEIVEIKEQIETIKQKLEESGTVVPAPEPTEQDGSTPEKTIDAYAGMLYYKGKYYKDPTDNSIYVCMDRADITDDGIRLYYTLSQLVGIYFSKVEIGVILWRNIFPDKNMKSFVNEYMKNM